VKIKQVAKK